MVRRRAEWTLRFSSAAIQRGIGLSRLRTLIRNAGGLRIGKQIVNQRLHTRQRRP